jgi:hypothetical protein
LLVAIRRETRQQIDRLIEGLNQEEAEDLIDYLNLRADPDSLSRSEAEEFAAGREEIRRGQYFTREQLRDKYGV